MNSGPAADRRRARRARLRISATTSVAALVFVVLAGCATTSPARPFADVRDDVKERSGYDVAWSRFDPGQEQIESAVAELLSREMAAQDAVQVALLNNRRLQAFYGRIGLAQAELVQAGLLKNPVFHGVLRWAPGGQRIFDFSVVQDFLDVLLMPLEIDEALAELEATKLEVTAKVLEVAGETKRAYYDYAANEQIVTLLESAVLSAESSYEMAHHLHQAGNIPEIEVLREQAAYERRKLELARAQAEAVRFRECLNRLMGVWGDGTEWTATAGLPGLPEALAETNAVERRALAASLDVRRTYVEIEAAARRFRVLEVMQIIPTFDLGGSAEFEKEETFKLVEHRRRSGNKYELKEVPGPTEVWGGPELSIAIPLFDQGQAARAAGRAEIQRRFDTYTALAIEVRSAARELSFRAANAAQRALFIREVALPLQESITAETQLRYNAMFDGVFRLLRAKEQEIDLRREYIEALHEFWVAHADLEQLLMGSLPDEFRGMMAGEQDGGMNLGARRSIGGGREEQRGFDGQQQH